MLDLSIPGGAIEAAAGSARDCLSVATAVMTVSECEHDVISALRAGARGYILKDSSGCEFVKVVHAVVRGDFHFAPNLAARLLEGEEQADGSSRQRQPLMISFTVLSSPGLTGVTPPVEQSASSAALTRPRDCRPRRWGGNPTVNPPIASIPAGRGISCACSDAFAGPRDVARPRCPMQTASASTFLNSAVSGQDAAGRFSVPRGAKGCLAPGEATIRRRTNRRGIYPNVGELPRSPSHSLSMKA